MNIDILTFHKNIFDKLDNIIQNNKIPNILFYGNYGSGKKYIASEFIKKLYGNNPELINKFVLYFNCIDGKGIKIIRDDIKTFSKMACIPSLGCSYSIKSIVLMNADKLTNDAQSALRFCIEQYSASTRFFIIVEDKSKILKPILSRFCEIHIPNPYVYNKNTKQYEFINFHKYNILNNITPEIQNDTQKNNKKIIDIINNFISQYDANTNIIASQQTLITLTKQLYGLGVAAIDILKFIKLNKLKLTISFIKKQEILLGFNKLIKEIRNEELLIFFILYQCLNDTAAAFPDLALMENTLCTTAI